jgi:phage-related protein
MTGANKLLVWLRGEVKTPPFSKAARVEAGFLLRRMQAGEKLSLPWSRPMPSIGTRCHELRITDKETIWRIVYRLDLDAILIVEVFQKKDTTDTETCD